MCLQSSGQDWQVALIQVRILISQFSQQKQLKIAVIVQYIRLEMWRRKQTTISLPCLMCAIVIVAQLIDQLLTQGGDLLAGVGQVVMVHYLHWKSNCVKGNGYFNF